MDECSWDLLKAHYDRGAVFLIKENITLVDAAVALAVDDVEQVKKWQNEEVIQPLTEDLKEELKSKPLEKLVKFIIVQPYVLVQKKVVTLQ